MRRAPNSDGQSKPANAAKKATKAGKRRPKVKRATEPAKIGRPTDYNEDVAAQICRRLYESEGNDLPESLRAICRDESMPGLSTVCAWLHRHPEFKDQYAQARELRRSALTDRLMFLSRDALNHAHGSPGTGEAGARVQAIKLEIDALKWILSKEYPREYGELIKQEVSGPNGGPIPTEARERSKEEMAAFAQMLKEADAKARPAEA
jgi:hypothetical protein